MPRHIVVLNIKEMVYLFEIFFNIVPTRWNDDLFIKLRKINSLFIIKIRISNKTEQVKESEV